jgi:biopolymer transport protein ExbD
MTKKRQRNSESAEVPMSSMIDVVFLLLIYFIVTQKDEVSEAHLAVNLPLPPQTNQEQKEPTLPLELSVYAGELRLGGLVLSEERVRETLEALVRDEPDRTVMVRISSKALQQDAVSALDICRSVGLENLNVVRLND